jgi:GNAT superfamily N-acetyltransferase
MAPEPAPWRVEALTGAAITPVIDDLARLRIAVFRDYPYLYDGDPAYESWYLGRFAAAPGALVVAAFAGEALVGAATAAPLAHEHDAFQEPFRRHGIDPESVFYLAESVLLPDWRGRGIGHAFFDAREAAGRRQGHRLAAFCAVVRPPDHRLRPEGYRPLDGFWEKRGYRPVPGLTTSFPWKELGEAEATAKPMQFWTKALDPAGPVTNS